VKVIEFDQDSCGEVSRKDKPDKPYKLREARKKTVPTALLEYLNLLQGGCSPPAPQCCYTYMIMIIKMIEIYNITAHCW